MAAISSPTEPELKKPKLDHGDKDEVQKVETLESIERTTNTESVDVLTSESRLDFYTRILDLKDELIVEFCKSALAHYQDNYPGESYEFESVQQGHRWVSRALQYYLEFCAKNLRADGNPLQIFNATVKYHPFNRPGFHYKVKKCVLLKDEVEKMETKDYRDMRMTELSLQDLKEKEYTDIVIFCGLALDYYLDEHPEESYEFESMQKVKRLLHHGWEYKLVFHAKYLRAGGKPLATFQALIYHLVRASQTVKCELLK